MREEKHETSNSIDYMFYTGGLSALTDCWLGGVRIQAVIDSGAGANMITKDTWEELKEKKVELWNQEVGSDRNFLAYGEVPIEVVGRFQAEVKIGMTTVEAKFYVVKQGKQNLLSKDTSEKLGVLKIGAIGQVGMKLSPFPKVIN